MIRLVADMPRLEISVAERGGMERADSVSGYNNSCRRETPQVTNVTRWLGHLITDVAVSVKLLSFLTTAFKPASMAFKPASMAPARDYRTHSCLPYCVLKD